VYIGEWQWLAWTNVPGFFDWVALILGVAGFGIAIWQLCKSKGALQAAKKALQETRATLVRNQLVFVLPAVGELANTLEIAASTSNRDSVVRALDRITDVAGEAAVLIQGSTSGQESVIEEILRCVDEASKAREKFYKDKVTAIEDIVAEASTSIRALTPKIRMLTVTLKNDPGGPRA
jgi:hypothetical protein